MIDFGVWQVRLTPVGRLPHHHQAGDRRLRSRAIDGKMRQLVGVQA